MPTRRRLALFTALLASVPPLAAQEFPLVPRPRHLTLAASRALEQGIVVATPAHPEDRHTASDLREAMAERGVPVVAAASRRPTVVLMRANTAAAQALLRTAGIAFGDSMRAEGYAILPDGARLVVIGATAAGVFYGAQTVKQLVVGYGTSARLQFARVRDWPAMRYRGVQDDLARGPVPTLDFQKRQIRTFAAYKINVYTPYFEHTLAFASHPLAAPPGGAMSRAEIRELVDYARRFHVEVIPQQQAFGHLHHLLKWERYAGLAETPRGHVLAPGEPGSLALIRSLFAEIDSLFPSRFIHIGADETFELGRGRTSPQVREQGIGRVYIDFLRRIADTLSFTGKRLLFWGDIAGNHPDLVRELPRNMIAVPWDYWTQRNFRRQIAPFRDAGMEVWVAPGVNNWLRPWPNYAVALGNIQGFAREGQELGATGLLNTTWDDDGDALFNQAWYGVLFGAAAAWQPGESSIAAFERDFGAVFHGDSTGAISEAQRQLAAAHRRFGAARLGEASNYYFWLDPWSTEGQLLAPRLLPAASEVRLHAESALVLVARARDRQMLREPGALEAMELGARRIHWIVTRFQVADDVARLYHEAAALAADTSAAGRAEVTQRFTEITHINGRIQDLRDGFGNLKALHERAWLAESRPYWKDNVLERYDAALHLWLARTDAVAAAWREYNRSGRVPPPDGVGIPPRKSAATP